MILPRSLPAAAISVSLACGTSLSKTDGGAAHLSAGPGSGEPVSLRVDRVVEVEEDGLDLGFSRRATGRLMRHRWTFRRIRVLRAAGRRALPARQGCRRCAPRFV